MSLSLRNNEQIKVTANFHWMFYFWNIVFCCFPVLGFIGILATKEPSLAASGYLLYSTMFFMGVASLAYKWLQNKCKKYVITNQRLYVEEGIIAKTKKDVPLSKINDFEMNQSILQRIFGSGNIRVLTGNDSVTVLKYIDNPEEFKNIGSELIATKQAA